MSELQKRARTVTGKVVSNKMEKSITVLIERRVKHRRKSRTGLKLIGQIGLH